MQLEKLVEAYSRHPRCRALAKQLDEANCKTIYAEGLQGSAASLVVASLSHGSEKERRRPMLVIMNDEEEAGYFYHDLVQIGGDADVLFFPSPYRRAVKYAQRDAGNEILRTEAMSRLASKASAPIVVTYPDALAVKVATEAHLTSQTVDVKCGDSINFSELGRRLAELGFRRVDYVYEPGDFALRGSIVDVFSYACELPYRIDFFGDEVDSIRTFNIETQLSDEKKESVSIVPQMEEEAGRRVSFTRFMPDDTLVIAKSLVYVSESIGRIYEQGYSEQARIEHEETLDDDNGRMENDILDKEQMLQDGAAFMKEISRFSQVLLAHRPDKAKEPSVVFHTKAQPLFHKNFELLAESFAENIRSGYKVYILADSMKQNERLKDIFKELNPAIGFTAVERTLHGGFCDDDLKACIYTDHQIFDRFHKYSLKSDKARNGKVALSLKELNQFEPGDYVVHVDHGIGRFAGLVRVTQGATEQEMMKLVYQNNDIVYVPIHALNKVSKYKGKDGLPPKLSKLGTGAWEKLKDRTKKHIKDIARDLIRLYSERQHEKGFAFSADGYMQHELEAGFAYEDTPDQLRVTQEVKKDMESVRPMDRLVCGDVGFGKTEIAVRAAFKAATDGKQVAVLVPTTVLAYQHYRTFSERLKNFPVTVDYLTRARSAEKVRAVKEGLATGKTEIVIGTHKLLGKTIRFKDLGLLIVDEEQKFGVATKERLRQLRVNVDTLTLTATPIPRTLQFSLMGARDLSVLQTPPPNRYPIRTEIHRFGHEVIADAINFEMSRNGQVFIVCNRIAKLPELENLIHKHVPDARVAIGHGQMPPEKLEKVIMDFVNYDYDVLLSTTIVENGIDIPNANTIIVDNAQNFGLSDLHQMRGRVGRGNRKAFCYLLAPPLSSLTADGRRRLEAIENFSELGSGIQIAMQDLDIRGAGNLLGAEQSGFIADLGYETYQKILSEAVTELKNDEFSDLYASEMKGNTELKGELFVEDCALDSDLPLFLPEEYIPGSSERMACYRELDGLKSDDEIEAFRRKMEDRFGPLPKESVDLLYVVRLRRIGRSLGMERILLKNGSMTLYFVSNLESAYYRSSTFGRVLGYVKHNFRRCSLSETNGKRRVTVKGVPSVAEAMDVLQKMAAEEADT